jgi:hypothetical protein
MVAWMSAQITSKNAHNQKEIEGIYTVLVVTLKIMRVIITWKRCTRTGIVGSIRQMGEIQAFSYEFPIVN